MIISTAALADHLHDPRWLVVDCRFDLDDPGRGERDYATAHIPGAVYAHLHRDLSGTTTGRNGRHPLPTVEQMAERFGRLGVGDNTQVVAYDADMGAYASRLWWMLRYLGHDAVAVLDGGFARWVAEGRPVESSGARSEPNEPRVFTPRVRPEMLVTIDEVADILNAGTARSATAPYRVGSVDAQPATAPDRVLIDARSPERYRGEVEPIDRVPGHIPGAINRHYQRNLGRDGRFRSPAELRAELSPLIGNTPADHVVCYCGSGVTACHNLLAMELAGIHGARLYAGSWSEWSADPARPVEEGDHGTPGVGQG